MKRPCRPGRLTDLRALTALEALCFEHPGERFHRRQIRGLLLNPRAGVFVIRRGGAPAGWAAGLVRRARGRCAGRLYALAVHPDYRGRGFGLRLAKAVLEDLRRRGARTVSLEVRADNRAARRLYEGLGFIAAGALPDYYGPGLHGLRMRRPAPAVRTRAATTSDARRSATGRPAGGTRR